MTAFGVLAEARPEAPPTGAGSASWRTGGLPPAHLGEVLPLRGGDSPRWLVALAEDPPVAPERQEPRAGAVRAVPAVEGQGPPSPAQLSQIAAKVGSASVYGCSVSAELLRAWGSPGSGSPAAPVLHDLQSLGHLLVTSARPPDLDRLLGALGLSLPQWHRPLACGREKGHRRAACATGSAHLAEVPPPRSLEQRAQALAAAVPLLCEAVRSLPLSIRLECLELEAELGWPKDPRFRSALKEGSEGLRGEALTPRGRFQSLFGSSASPPKIRARRRPHLRIVEETRKFFDPDGALARFLAGFEDRPSQRALAEAVASAFAEGAVLFAEAGTGVGKTLAYLVPSILWSLATGERVAISTATKHLQNQIFLKDLPAIEEALGIPVDVAVVKGRGNYLCCRKLFHLYLQSQGADGGKQRAALLPLLAWASRSDELDLTELGELESPSPLGSEWPLARLASDGQGCPQRSCPHFQACALERLRERVGRAGLAIVNHALLCSGTRAGSLPDFGAIILDEAHSLEDILAEQFGIAVDAGAVRALLRRIVGKDPFSLAERLRFFLPARRPRRGSTTSRPSGSARASAGRSPGGTSGPADPDALEKAARAVHEALDACAEAWLSLQLADGSASFAPPRRAFSLSRGRIRLRPETLDSEPGRKLSQACGTLGQALEDMAATLGRLAESVGATPTLGGSPPVRQLADPARTSMGATARERPLGRGPTSHPEDRTSLARETGSAAEEFRSLAADLSAILDLSQPGAVSWGEGMGEGGQGAGGVGRREDENRGALSFSIRHPSFVLGRSPLDVGEILRDTFLAQSKAALLCSGTLTVQGSAEFFVHRLGLRPMEERLRVRVFPSDYDFREQVLVCAVGDLPDPGTRGWEAELARSVAAVLGARAGRAMVLFTARQTMEQVYKLAKPALHEADLPALCQYQDGSRTGLQSALIEGSAAALFATRSFFEGVDLPGEALEVLILTRLPFPVPTDALTQARAEQVAEAGGDPMMDYHLPRAVISFRQAFGRLVRSRNDRGVLVVLDSRILRRGYGRSFLGSLPPHTFCAGDLGTVVGGIRQWMGIQRNPERG